jgi:hypothetical protein
VLIHVAIEAAAGAAAAVAQRLAFVKGLTLREIQNESRLIGTFNVPDSCPLDDVLRMFRAEPAVLAVHHLATNENEHGVAPTAARAPGPRQHRRERLRR